MTMPRSLAIAAILLGSTAVAFAQGAGIAPNSSTLPPQSAYGYNGYGYPYRYAPQQYYGLYNYAPGYYRHTYVRHSYRHWHY